ncbi:MAG: hypothetical protein ACWGOV_12865 [Acidiferrobacterales bacterium]
MALKNWRSIVASVLSEKVGPTADLMIDETLRDMHTLEGEMVASRFLVFLKRIYKVLPEDIDRNELVYKMRNKVLSQYGFSFDK